jgi:hypothetical protein
VTSSFLEKLMMEYDVFKCFVSANPLDGLYLYLKSFSFISQYKNTEKTGNFVFVGYIRNIQRARKKWFFIELEDISGTMEFFVKDVLDLKRFDILIVYGYKGRSFSIEKIVRTSREKLIQQAWSKYDPEMTVVKAKSLRMSSEPSIFVPTPLATPLKKIEADKGSIYKLPDNVQKLQDLAYIINTHKGEQELKIGEKVVKLDDVWVEKVKFLLA